MEIADIGPGQGKTGLVGTNQVAVFNDHGTLIVMENLCTHMGCQTEWNAAAATWDCPCHGSRFHGDGSVMVGPALTPLRRLDFQIIDGRLQV